MIWATGPQGSVSYVGPEWTLFTGQPADEALGQGWVEMLHTADRATALSTLDNACSAKASFTIQYRLLRTTGTYARVVSGATPSISPVDGRFLGYLGAVVEVDGLIDELREQSGFGRLIIPPSPASTMPLTILDQIADHVLMARSLAQQGGAQELYACLDLAIAMVHAKTGGSTQQH